MAATTGMLRYDTRVLAVGEQVEAFRGEGMLVLFAEGAPDELHEICALHRPAGEPAGAVAAGDVIDIDGHELVVTAVGDRANENLAQLGHVSLKANGLDTAPLPGDICVTGELPAVAPGSVVRISTNDVTDRVG